MPRAAKKAGMTKDTKDTMLDLLQARGMSRIDAQFVLSVVGDMFGARDPHVHLYGRDQRKGVDVPSNMSKSDIWLAYNAAEILEEGGSKREAGQQLFALSTKRGRRSRVPATRKSVPTPTILSRYTVEIRGSQYEFALNVPLKGNKEQQATQLNDIINNQPDKIVNVKTPEGTIKTGRELAEFVQYNLQGQYEAAYRRSTIQGFDKGWLKIKKVKEG